MENQVKIGCCGFPRGMGRYFDTFGVVELQKTFYKLPKPETAARWRESAPDGFEFTLKAWQGITHLASSPTYRKAGIKFAAGEKEQYGHFRPTEAVRRAWRDTCEIARILRARIIVLQCPPNFRQSPEAAANLDDFLKAASAEGFRLALEFRAPWDEELIDRWIRKYGIIHCVDPFAASPRPGAVAYFRLHGAPPGERMYRYTYTDADLQRLQRMVQQELDAGRDVYCLFNNVTMWEDALRFREILG